MPLAEAQALAPGLAIATYESSADRRALAKLAEGCERFSPSVAIEEGDAPESLLLNISNLEHLWGSETALAGQVEKFFTRRGYRVKLAAAETMGLAWALAHFSAGERVACFRAAQRSVSMPEDDVTQRSRGMPAPYMLTPAAAGESMPPFEIQLPIESLRIDGEIAALLRQLGIETVDQLAALPREDLGSRFGDDLLRRLDQLTDAAREVAEPHRALAPLEASHALDEPTADRFVLMQVLKQLVERLARQMAVRDQGAVLLMCSLRCTDGRTVPLRIGLLQPSANARQLLELIDLHLENAKLTAEVDRAQLRVAVVGRLGQRQSELFADGWSRDSHQLPLLVNRLSSRLGHKQVLRAELRASPVPERAVRWAAAVERSRKMQNAKCKMQNAKWQSSAIKNLQFRAPPGGWSCNLQSSPRPLLLHPEPETLEVVCIAPDGPPQFVWLKNHRQRIVHFAGPERIETLWWRGPSVRRDYYRVALESGNHLWIFRRLSDGRWFLHGAFA
jgi:protein ImuB